MTTQSVIFVVTFFYPIRNDNVTTQSVNFVVTFSPIGNKFVTTPIVTLS